jgi:hypothetical protein
VTGHTLRSSRFPKGGLRACHHVFIRGEEYLVFFKHDACMILRSWNQLLIDLILPTYILVICTLLHDFFKGKLL